MAELTLVETDRILAVLAIRGLHQMLRLWLGAPNQSPAWKHLDEARLHFAAYGKGGGFQCSALQSLWAAHDALCAGYLACVEEYARKAPLIPEELTKQEYT